jgi:hypothetical protein
VLTCVVRGSEWGSKVLERMVSGRWLMGEAGLLRDHRPFYV